MAKAPWFKTYAQDLLLDSKLRKLPLAAQGLVYRMWCVIWLEGCISSDPKEIAQVCLVDISDVQMYLQMCLQMFHKDADGTLYSPRMDREREHSEKISFVRAAAVAKRQDRQNKGLSTIVVTKPINDVDTKDLQSESESESDIKPQHATKRGSRIPEDFKVTEEHRGFCKSFGYSKPETYFDEFVDYWKAKPGQAGCKLDWDATFRNWIRNGEKRKGNGHAKVSAEQFNLTGGLEQVMANRRANGFH